MHLKISLLRLHEKFGLGLALAALMATFPIDLRAQTSAPAPANNATQVLSAEDLDDLLGPIALYPDALVGLILPASTVPSDVTLAARYLNSNGNNANVDDQPWDPSVRGLAKYPDVLKWMDDNLEWTTSVGEAFVEQPADVMSAIQDLRIAANDKGNLVNTPQQTIVVEQRPDTRIQEIRIVPTDPEIIYVPQYDPQIVYVQQYEPDDTPLIAFGVGFAVGAWLSYDFDWGNRGFYYGDHCGWNNHNRWNDHGWNDRNYDNGNVNIVNNNTNINNITNANRWQPSANSQRHFNQRRNQNLGNARIARANAQVRAPNSQRPRNASERIAAASQRPARVARPKHPNAVAHRNNNRPNPVAATRAPGANNRKPKHNPSAAPQVAGGNAKPSANKSKNPPGHGQGQGNRPKPTGQVKRPSAPPQQRPQPKPQVRQQQQQAQSQPKPQVHQQQQQSRPQPQRPKQVQAPKAPATKTAGAPAATKASGRAEQRQGGAHKQGNGKKKKKDNN